MEQADSDAYNRWKIWRPETFGLFAAADALYFSAELRRTGLALESGLRILEIGFGNGGFAGWAKSHGFDYVGTELSEQLVSRGRLAGLTVFPASPDFELPAGHKLRDLVVAFDVFEHLSLQLFEAHLVGIRDLLRAGGLLLARVPSGDSPFGRAIFHGDVTHQLVLGSSAIRQIADRHGFEVLEIGPPALPVRGLGLRVAIRRVFLKVARQLVGRVINTLFHERQPCVITSNLVFILRKPS